MIIVSLLPAQEEFAYFHRQTLYTDIDEFNEKMIDWLIFYNTKRVHHAFGNKLSPDSISVQFLLEYEQTLSADCKSMYGYTMCSKNRGNSL